MSTKSATKQGPSNWLVDPRSRFHRSCHVGDGRGTKSVQSSVLSLSLADMNDMADRRQADRKLSEMIV